MPKQISGDLLEEIPKRIAEGISERFLKENFEELMENLWKKISRNPCRKF